MRATQPKTITMSSAIEVSTPHRFVRSNPPHSPAFHHASRKSATLLLCPGIALCNRNQTFQNCLWSVVIVAAPFKRHQPKHDRFLPSRRTVLCGCIQRRGSTRGRGVCQSGRARNRERSRWPLPSLNARKQVEVRPGTQGQIGQPIQGVPRRLCMDGRERSAVPVFMACSRS